MTPKAKTDTSEFVVTCESGNTLAIELGSYTALLTIVWVSNKHARLQFTHPKEIRISLDGMKRIVEIANHE